ncbi:MAG: heavy metal-associated domain-containing protein [Candidatus Sericytochromatia bacterium]
MSNNITLLIEGMHCQSCVGKVQDSLKQLENIENVSVDLNSGKADLSFNGDLPTEKTLRRAIDKTGFTLVEIKG